VPVEAKHTKDKVLRRSKIRLPMSQLGQSRPSWPLRAMSALPQIATEQRTSRVVRLVTAEEDPLFSEAAEEIFDALRARILQLEQEAEAERH